MAHQAAILDAVPATPPVSHLAGSDDEDFASASSGSQRSESPSPHGSAAFSPVSFRTVSSANGGSLSFSGGADGIAAAAASALTSAPPRAPALLLQSPEPDDSQQRRSADAFGSSLAVQAIQPLGNGTHAVSIEIGQLAPQHAGTSEIEPAVVATDAPSVSPTQSDTERLLPPPVLPPLQVSLALPLRDNGAAALTVDHGADPVLHRPCPKIGLTPQPQRPRCSPARAAAAYRESNRHMPLLIYNDAVPQVSGKKVRRVTWAAGVVSPRPRARRRKRRRGDVERVAGGTCASFLLPCPPDDGALPGNVETGVKTSCSGAFSVCATAWGSFAWPAALGVPGRRWRGADRRRHLRIMIICTGTTASTGTNGGCCGTSQLCFSFAAGEALSCAFLPVLLSPSASLRRRGRGLRGGAAGSHRRGGAGAVGASL